MLITTVSGVNEKETPPNANAEELIKPFRFKGYASRYSYHGLQFFVLNTNLANEVAHYETEFNSIKVSDSTSKLP